MKDRPAPLTLPECDLRGMPYMALDVIRLFDSDFYALSTGDEFKAGMTLFGRAFLQVPAGSLPDDDRILAHLSCAGANWCNVKDMALRGWIKCSDGRLYHPTLAEKVADAWQARIDRRARTEAARKAKLAAKHASNGSQPPPSVTVSVTEPVTRSVTDNVTRIVADSVTTPVTQSVTGSKGTEGNGREEERKKGSEADASGTAGAAPGVATSPRDQIWTEGVTILRRLTGQADRPARAALGRLLRTSGDDCAKVFNVLWDATDARPVDPMAWLVAALRPEKRRNAAYNPFLDPAFDEEEPKQISRLGIEYHVH